MDKLRRYIPSPRFMALCAVLPFILCSCENKVSQADELVQKAQYQQAIDLLRDADSSSVDVRNLLQKAHIGLLKQAIRDKQYEQARRIIGDLPSAIRASPEVAALSKSLQEATKGIVAGIWDGNNASSRKTLIAMELKALTSSSFNGTLDFKGEPWDGYQRLIIENGVFDGQQLSGQLFVLKIRAGRAYKGAQLQMSGTIDKDTMRLTLDLNPYLIPSQSTNWILVRPKK